MITATRIEQPNKKHQPLKMVCREEDGFKMYSGEYKNKNHIVCVPRVAFHFNRISSYIKNPKSKYERLPCTDDEHECNHIRRFV